MNVFASSNGRPDTKPPPTGPRGLVGGGESVHWSTSSWSTSPGIHPSSFILHPSNAYH
ncbi:MAG: hypothetical protein ACXW5U_14895 [Thermoanaerobaculia bacterium]